MEVMESIGIEYLIILERKYKGVEQSNDSVCSTSLHVIVYVHLRPLLKHKLADVCSYVTQNKKDLSEMSG